MVRKLAIRSLRREIGSMDYIHTLLIAEDDLDDGSAEDLCEYEEEPADMGNTSGAISHEPSQGSTENPKAAPEWCVCSNCRPMPQDIENRCCKCITYSSHFTKICLDPQMYSSYAFEIPVT